MRILVVKCNVYYLVLVAKSIKRNWVVLLSQKIKHYFSTTMMASSSSSSYYYYYYLYYFYYLLLRIIIFYESFSKTKTRKFVTLFCYACAEHTLIFLHVRRILFFFVALLFIFSCVSKSWMHPGTIFSESTLLQFVMKEWMCLSFHDAVFPFYSSDTHPLLVTSSIKTCY